jgi:hypothetical protein
MKAKVWYCSSSGWVVRWYCFCAAQIPHSQCRFSPLPFWNICSLIQPVSDIFDKKYRAHLTMTVRSEIQVRTPHLTPDVLSFSTGTVWRRHVDVKYAIVPYHHVPIHTLDFLQLITRIARILRADYNEIYHKQSSQNKTRYVTVHLGTAVTLLLETEW